MKQIKLQSLLTAFTALLFCQFLYGQNDMVREPDQKRPTAFASLPDTLVCNFGNTNKAMESRKSETVSIPVSDNLTIYGLVLTNKKLDSNRTVLIVKSLIQEGFMLTLIKEVLPGGSSRLSGQLISLKYKDVYILQTEGNDVLWIKKNFFDIINE